MFNKKSLSEIDCDINIPKRGLANHNNASDNSDAMVDGELKVLASYFHLNALSEQNLNLQ